MGFIKISYKKSNFNILGLTIISTVYVLVLVTLNYIHPKNVNPTIRATTITPITSIYRLNSNLDRANQDGNNMIFNAPDSKDNRIGNANNKSSSYLGLRFSGPIIPSSAQIQKATLEVSCSRSGTEKIKFNIFAEKTLAPMAFTSQNLISSRSLTSTFISASVSQAWIKTNTYSFDVTELVKELINNKGNVGNIALIAKGVKSSGDFYYIFNETHPTLAPKLTITYLPAE